MNTLEKQYSNELANKKYQNQNLNAEDDFLDPKDPKEVDDEDDLDDEDLEEESEYPVDKPGNDFNEIEEEIDEEPDEEEDDEDETDTSIF